MLLRPLSSAKSTVSYIYCYWMDTHLMITYQDEGGWLSLLTASLLNRSSIVTFAVIKVLPHQFRWRAIQPKKRCPVLHFPWNRALPNAFDSELALHELVEER